MSTPGFLAPTVEGTAADQAKCDRLHFLKNRPPVPEIDGEPISFPPYSYQRFPAAMYHASDPSSPKMVHTEQEERNLLSRGWGITPADAEAHAKIAEEARATDAAVRAFDDQRMSVKAKAEVEQLEQDTDDFVSAVPVPKKRGRPRKEAA